MVVASRDGGWLRRALRDSPGKDGRNCLVMAVSRVDKDGDHSAAWWKATMSAGVFLFVGWVATLAVATWYKGWKLSGMDHSPVGVLLSSMWPPSGHSMIPPPAWRLIVHPASHRGPAPRRDLSIVGKMWAVTACWGKPRSGSCAVCVECMSWPLATWTAMGLDVAAMLVRPCAEAKKCPVLPESTMMGGAGPGVVGCGSQVCNPTSRLVDLPGVPPSYSCLVGVGLGSSRVLRCCLLDLAGG